MSLLPNGPIIIFYNGVTFPTETISSVKEKPILDASRRTVKMVVYTINVKATIGQTNQVASATTDATMASLRNRLAQNGGELHYEGAGYGAIVANVPAAGPTVGTASPARDVVWGPQTRELKWVAKGQMAAEVEWEIDVALEPCDDAVYTGGILEFVYSLTMDIDQSGYSKRTIKGSYSIPQTKASVGATGITDSASRLRDKFVPALLRGFRRIPGTYELSLDKCTESFSIVDVEIGPNYPPPGVVDVKMSHSIRSAVMGSTVGGKWICVVRGSYEMVRGVDRSLAWQYFFTQATFKAQNAFSHPLAVPGSPPFKPFVLITAVSLSEPEVYGRLAGEFSLQFEILSRLEQIVLASGLWQPIPDNNWLSWSQSMAKGPFNTKGNANLVFDPSSESIIDLCHQANNTTLAGGVPTLPATPPPTNRNLRSDTLRNKIPDPATSWLRYESYIEIETNDNVIELKPLPPPQSAPPATPGGGVPGSGSGGGPGFGIVGSGPSYGLTTAPGGSGGYSLVGTNSVGPSASSIGVGSSATISASYATSIVQRRAEPTYYAHLTGSARRAGYPVTPPSLTSVGGRPVVADNLPDNGFEQVRKGSLFGVNIYEGSWNFRYLIVGTPTGQVPVMDAPFPGA